MPGSVGCMLPNLATQRAAAGLSLNDLARQGNTPVYVIVQIETGGNVDCDTAHRLAAALGLTVNDLGDAPLN